MSVRAADVAWMGELRERVHVRLREEEADDEDRWNADPELVAKSGTWRANRTRDYADLIFAFGLARLGASEDSCRLRAGAASLADADPAHQFLLAAFSHRIEDADAGRPHLGPLAESLARRLEGMDKISRYVVDRLRRFSRILEPEVRANPYRFWGPHCESESKVAQLQGQPNAEAFQREADWLLASPYGCSPEGRSRIGLVLLQQYSFGRVDQILQAVRDAVSRNVPEGEDDCFDPSGCVNAALPAAARFGFRDELLALTSKVSRWMSRCGGRRFGFPELIRSSVDALSVVDGPHGPDEFIAEISRAVLGDLSSAEWAARATTADSAGAGILLALAERWYRFGRDDLADPVLDGTFSHIGVLRARSAKIAHDQSHLEGDLERALRSASVSDHHIKGLFRISYYALTAPELRAGAPHEWNVLRSVLNGLTDLGIRRSFEKREVLQGEYGEIARSQHQLVKDVMRTLHSASLPVARFRLRAIFEVMPRWRDTYTTNPYFWSTAIEYVESLCLTAVEVSSNG